ncbi:MULTISPECIES: branched-chain amino acid ABC transporter permease [unclassified Microbacterium]|uniref:branched-chain amino acid ABC transporter permease n=1 Tax=unclassified Microbacterium TaxID=2609290 RepID=UPI00097EA43D|nr:branched-chain amino acid ABC transporter permease [Microbacterium sp. JB110]RCS58800.1 branched-chain amino acid ABC transporter permease [Microbacterium sp. JB110]SJM54599.1 High-affinity branched-chain amino acid transport system permease protein LivH (TC 3.A.1.4.1) [Frigoribacterium sp. JB110]
MTGALLFQSLILGILLGGLYALLAAGLTLYFGVMRVVMLAHAAFVMLAAYIAWFFTTRTGLDPMLSLVISVPLFFLLGYAIQRWLISRLKPATMTMMSVLITFALALLIEGGLGMAFTGTQRRLDLSYGTSSLNLFGASIPIVQIISFGLAALSLASLYLLMKKSKFGQALRATIQHPEAARLVGIDTGKVAGLGFGLGLATAAVGGVAMSLQYTIFPSLHWHWIGPLMAIIVVGGLGSIPGAAIAAMLLGIIRVMLEIPLGPTWAQTIFYVALFVTLMVRPQGFFGGRLAQRF